MMRTQKLATSLALIVTYLLWALPSALASHQMGRPALDCHLQLAGLTDLEVQRLLKLDNLNLSYFMALYRAKVHPKGEDNLHIFEEGMSTSGRKIAYPTAVAPAELLKQLPYVNYEDIVREDFAAEAQRAVLWVKKMQAGTGSSVTRTSYLSKMRGIAESDVVLGAKGTDLYVALPDPTTAGKTVNVSLAEMQILQMMAATRKQQFGRVIFHDIVSTETEKAVADIWKKPSYFDRTKTYEQVVSEDRHLSRTQGTFQSYLPLVTGDQAVTFAKQAPGGHSLFAVDALRAAYIDELRPQTQGRPLVSVIGNGEDLSSTPDSAMVGWMIKEKAPIVMITTEKTSNDLKGGQISLVKDEDGRVYSTIIETIQAKQSGQTSLFEKLGLDVRRDGQIAFFNTNMVMFNYEVLVPKIKKLINEVGEAEFMKIVAPDLISKPVEAPGRDGSVQKLSQLEGTMGSTLLNLDRFWRAHYGEPLVHFINVGHLSRTQFFSPIKFAFDYYMQFHSDRFKLDLPSMHLVNLRPEAIPLVTLKDAATGDKFYQDLETILKVFNGASILNLNALHVEGQVLFQNLILRGQVTVVNNGGGVIDLNEVLAKDPRVSRDLKTGHIILENVKVEVDSKGATVHTLG